MYRYMRLLVLFDLPMDTASERKHYTKFRKFLIKSGFLMLQRSVYCKLLLNSSQMETVKEQIRKNKPPDGLVQMLGITEKQYLRIEAIVGKPDSEVIDTDERTLII